MTGQNTTVHRRRRETRNADPIKPEEGVGTQDGRKIKVSGRGSNIVSSMERRRVTPPEIARMQRKLKRGSRAGQLHKHRHQSLYLGR